MRVRCIKDHPHNGVGGRNCKLIAGQIYEVAHDDGREYTLVGVGMSWAHSRFEIIGEEDATTTPTAATPTVKPTNSDLDFFARPADPTHCKCGIPKKQCGYHS